ncbi:branched-chain amino acid aminotransferase [Malaciobacter mytili LMG 24559]|uniref:Branched-chain amino acid aminotransferase n=1 Tax=Malaciobacter mytili LMG 24559 TaxID=1032238 RepID=A0AAX2AK42_9BACT|nr:aminotransferase class IV [Malaciobacter mytili]AXH15941.1 branched-chain amino acid aminotransferase, possible 4-amino-4-deoxychorismate lyase PabC [Malaciobacter mytili LMG 24559]RXK15956.1 branched-chain amino acid aminotransferase [Malaciobacter mytili LMG 24559]
MENKVYFETIKCEDYEIFNLEYHNKRVANTIAKNFDLGEYIYPLSNKLLRCKVIYNEDEIIDINYFEYKKRQIKSFKIVNNDNISYSKKYLNREILDNIDKQGCDEVMIFKQGYLTDTTISNIAVLVDNIWFTPKKPLLQGTTRQRYLDSGFLKQLDITFDILKKASKIALLNAMIDFDIIEDYSLSL